MDNRNLSELATALLRFHQLRCPPVMSGLEITTFLGFMGVVSLLRQGDTEGTGVGGDLGNIYAVGRRP